MFEVVDHANLIQNFIIKKDILANNKLLALIKLILF